MRLVRFVIPVCAVVAALTTAAPALAAKPCYQKVIDDWYKHGQVEGQYPIHCYTEAIAKLPPDSKEYSSAPEDIRRAMLLAIRGQSGGGPTSGPSAGPSAPSGGSSTGTGKKTGGGTGKKHHRTGSKGHHTTTPSAEGPSRGLAVATGFGVGPQAAAGVGSRHSSKGFIDRVLNSFGPKNASSVPLPLIILAAVALLLLAAGAVSFAARRMQGRRIPPPRP